MNGLRLSMGSIMPIRRVVPLASASAVGLMGTTESIHASSTAPAKNARTERIKEEVSFLAWPDLPVPIRLACEIVPLSSTEGVTRVRALPTSQDNGAQVS